MTTKLSDLTAQTTVEGLTTALGLDQSDPQQRVAAAICFAFLKGASALTSIANTYYAQKPLAERTTVASEDMARAALQEAGLGPPR